MCFLIENKIKVTDREITCYKWVEKKNPELALSAVRKHPYLKGVTQPMVYFASRDMNYVKIVDFGYHSWNTTKYGANAEFIIPRGSKYYFNPYYEEYVSDCIKFKRYI